MGRLQRGGQFYVMLREALLCAERSIGVVGALDASEKAVDELMKAGISSIYVGCEELLKVLRDVDVVHMHDGFRLLLYARFRDYRLDKVLREKPLVVTYHGMPSVFLLPFRSWFTWIAFKSMYYGLVERYANVVVAISSYVAEELRRRGIEPVVIYNGVDIPSDVGSKHLEKDVLRVLYVGSGAKHKAVDELVKFFLKYRDRLCRDLDLEVKVTIAGFQVDKRCPRSRPPWLEVYSSIPREKVLDLYREGHIYVSASRWEGFGLGPLEALAHGTPVILRDTPVVRELFSSCESVCIVPNFRSYEHVLKAFRYIVEHYEEISKRGIKYAKRFSWDKHIEKLIDIYTKILRKQ